MYNRSRHLQKNPLAVRNKKGCVDMLFLYWKRSFIEFAVVIAVFLGAVINCIWRERQVKFSKDCYYCFLLQGIHFLVFLYLHELKGWPLTYTWMLIELAVFCLFIVISILTQGPANTLATALGIYLTVWLMWVICSAAWHLGALAVILVVLVFLTIGTNI